MDQLMQKLMASKAIMDKSDKIGRGVAQPSINTQNINVENYDIPSAKYNIPKDILQENRPTMQTSTPDRPMKTPSVDAIKNSKLPDEIKRLMIEHPIVQPSMQTAPTLSDELIEKASRLMKENSNNYVPESAQTPKKNTSQNSNSTGVDYNLLRNIVKEVVEESLRENGVIAESSEKSNEIFSFKVGKHIFEGKVTKIKKLQ
jgi:hypothetical protein